MPEILQSQLRKAVGPSTAVGVVTDYVREINVIPNTWGRINQMGLFSDEGVATTTVVIDQVEDTIGILPPVLRGGPASRAKQEFIKQLPLIIPHFPHDDYMTPMDVQDRRGPGDIGPDTRTRVLMKKMQNMRRKHALTLEHMRMGAIKGIVMAGDGQTLVNLFTEFGITQTTIDFDLDTATTEVLNKIDQLWRHMEENLKMGEPVSQIHVFCSTGFFDALITHPTVKVAYQHYNATNQIAVSMADFTAAQTAGRQPLRDTTRRGFTYGNVVFEEYNGSVTRPDGTVEQFIPADEARAFIPNVPDLFRTYYAPADRLQYVNTTGLPIYMFQTTDPEDRYIKLYSESNPLPICTRPATLVRLTRT